MIDFVNVLYLDDQKYQTSGTETYDNYKGKLLFTITKSLSFLTYLQSVFYLLTILLKDNIDGVHVPPFKLAYICSTTNTLHNNLVTSCCDVHYMWLRNLSGKLKSGSIS